MREGPYRVIQVVHAKCDAGRFEVKQQMLFHRTIRACDDHLYLQPNKSSLLHMSSCAIIGHTSSVNFLTLLSIKITKVL